MEEVFKTSFGNQNLQTPSLATIMTMNNLYEQASKIWFSYIESEKKGTYAKIPAWEFHSQLVRKRHKWWNRCTPKYVRGFWEMGLRQKFAKKIPIWWFFKIQHTKSDRESLKKFRMPLKNIPYKVGIVHAKYCWLIS